MSGLGDLSSLLAGTDPFSSGGSSTLPDYGASAPIDLGGSLASWGDLSNTMPSLPADNSSPDFFSSLGDAFGNAFGSLSGQALGIGTQLASYGLTSLGNQTARQIGQATAPYPQYYPYPASAAPSLSPTLLILLAAAGVGLFLVMKGK